MAKYECSDEAWRLSEFELLMRINGVQKQSEATPVFAASDISLNYHVPL